MLTIIDRWRSYCDRHMVSATDREYAAALLESAQSTMRERAARAAEQRAETLTGPDCRPPTPGQIAEAVRALSNE